MEVLKISTNSIEIDIFNKLLNVFDGNSDKYHKVNRLISILNKHYSAMIIFTLHKLDFSANWELFTLANLKDKHAIQQNMSDLMMAGIVVLAERSRGLCRAFSRCHGTQGSAADSPGTAPPTRARACEPLDGL